MKKILFVFLFSLLGGLAFANMTEFSQVVQHKSEQAAYKHFVARQMQQEARQGNTKKLKEWFKQTDKSVWLQTDQYGNNLFHLCRNEETFYVLWNFLVSVRDEMLVQPNNAGEIPWVKLIMYGKEKIFLKYFPKSNLYIRLQEATKEMNDQGLTSAVAKIKREELIKECSVGGKTMWQRADALCKGLASGMAKGFASYSYSAKDAYVGSKGSFPKNDMELVREMIESVAPFLVR